MQRYLTKISPIITRHKVLTIILALAALLRLYNLWGNPVSPYWDEVSIGYNAYSISQTARDEWGQPLPLLFEAFGEYKLPGQIYLTVPFVKIFGLNNFSIRIPSVIMGILAIWAIYLVTQILAKTIYSKKSNTIALFSAFLLAISPWHLQFSRAAFEANSAITLFAFGLYFLLKASKKSINYYFSALLFALSFYFYYHTRIIIPLLLIFYLIFFHQTVLKNLKTVIISTFFGLLLCLPIIFSLVSPQSQNRAKTVSVIDLSTPQTNPDFVKAYTKYQALPIPPNFKDKFAWSDVLFSYYLRHTSLDFLFIKGDSQARHNTPNQGLLYYFQIPLILFGAVILLKKRSKESLLIIFLSLIFPISAIFSDLTPHALRSSLGSFNLTLLSAFGVLPFLKRKTIKNISILIIFLSLSFYLYQYHVVAPKNNSLAWGYGHKELFSYLKPRTQPIIVSGGYWNPYIYYLYYNQTDPSSYQKIKDKKTHYKNYFFAGANWDGRSALTDNLIKNQLQSGKNLLVISPPEDVQITIPRTLIHTISDNNQTVVFLIYEINN